MDSPNLVIICIASFTSVLVILSILAIIMRFLLVLFPVKEEDNNAAVFAAITSAYNRQFPGTKVIKIGEDKWYSQKMQKKLK